MNGISAETFSVRATGEKGNPVNQQAGSLFLVPRPERATLPRRQGQRRNVRYVTLPFESHGYAARETIEHTLREMLSWFDQHMENASSKSAVPSGSIAN
jgi:hypothetical protein